MESPIKHLPSLPAERALKVIGGRWKPIILYHLFFAPQRLAALEKLVTGISQKVLLQQLKEMQAHGIVAREVAEGHPTKVLYSATPLGRTLEPVLLALCEWGQKHAVELNELSRLTNCEVETRRLKSKRD